ncbi:MAG: cytochrome c biogenesis protein CcsA [Myxococcales bacterium]|nr:cytochrome c biogenesis protein CcsA [Myxococcales bacterium]
MPPLPDPALSAASHPLLSGLFLAAAGSYVLALAVAMVRPRWGRWPLAAGACAHLLAMIGRGWAIGFFPLTNKHESFSALALAIAATAALSFRPRRLYLAAMLALACASMGAALLFPFDLAYPPPLMRTVWYPLHVPLSFLAYALFCASAASGLVWAQGRDPEWLRAVDLRALQGFGLWSLAMITGGVWGVLAWGAYFLWDPKVIWSVILWFHYATFIHLRLTPSLKERPWVRPALAWLGLAWLFVAYVGTSFFLGDSSHAF